MSKNRSFALDLIQMLLDLQWDYDPINPSEIKNIIKLKVHLMYRANFIA
jgi:hypothetical protein